MWALLDVRAGKHTSSGAHSMQHLFFVSTLWHAALMTLLLFRYSAWQESSSTHGARADATFTPRSQAFVWDGGTRRRGTGGG